MSIVRGVLTKTLTLSVDETASTSIYIGDMVRGAIQIPTEMTGSALRFEVSVDDSNFESLADHERAVLDQLPGLSANDMPSIPYLAFNYPYLRIRSGTTQATEDAEISVWLGG